MSQQEPPKIEFPCPNYPVKVIGQAYDDYDRDMLRLIQQHAPDASADNMKVNDSRQGRFRSLTFYITATGVEQLSSLHRELSAHDAVKMVI